MNLRFSDNETADLLRGFECGVDKMDDFIRVELDSFLSNHPELHLCIVHDQDDKIVAMFVTGHRVFIDYDNEIKDLPYPGKPFAFFENDGSLGEGTQYPSLEIEYLAVQQQVQGKDIGTRIIDELCQRAKSQHLLFLTVQAYHTKDYSAIPFYEKTSFFPLEEYHDDNDTLRMARSVF